MYKREDVGGRVLIAGWVRLAWEDRARRDIDTWIGAGLPMHKAIFDDEKLVIADGELFVVTRVRFPDGVAFYPEMKVPKGHWSWDLSVN